MGGAPKCPYPPPPSAPVTVSHLTWVPWRCPPPSVCPTAALGPLWRSPVPCVSHGGPRTRTVPSRPPYPHGGLRTPMAAPTPHLTPSGLRTAAWPGPARPCPARPGLARPRRARSRLPQAARAARREVAVQLQVVEAARRLAAAPGLPPEQRRRRQRLQAEAAQRLRQLRAQLGAAAHGEHRRGGTGLPRAPGGGQGVPRAAGGGNWGFPIAP